MAKRERIATGTEKRYVRRDQRGRFVRSDDIGRSLSAEHRTTVKDTSTKGPGNRSRTSRATERTSWFGKRPMGLSVAVVAGLIAITAGAVIASASLVRGETR